MAPSVLRREDGQQLPAGREHQHAVPVEDVDVVERVEADVGRQVHLVAGAALRNRDGILPARSETITLLLSESSIATWSLTLTAMRVMRPEANAARYWPAELKR